MERLRECLLTPITVTVESSSVYQEIHMLETFHQSRHVLQNTLFSWFSMRKRAIDIETRQKLNMIVQMLISKSIDTNRKHCNFVFFHYTTMLVILTILIMW